MDPQPTETGNNRNPDGTFKPGVSGNPGGRPPGPSITAAVRRKLEEQYNNLVNPEEKKTYLEKIIDSIFFNAIDLKDARSLKDIWAYIDGLPKQQITVDVDRENLQALTEFFKSMGNGNSESKSV